MSEPIQQLWLYNNWANKTLLSAFNQQAAILPPSCLHLFSHIVNAQMIWSSRINGEKPIVGVWEDHSLSTCERYHHVSSAALEQKIGDYIEGEVITINYTNSKNESFSSSLLDILLHVFNHGTYHRAQIASEMRRNGLEPVNTDYIVYVRS